MRIRVGLLGVCVGMSVSATALAQDVPTTAPSDPTRRDGERSAEVRPGVLNEAAALPGRFGGYGAVTGGVAPDVRGRAAPLVEGAALFGLARRFAIGAGFASLPPSSEQGRSASPSVTVYAQPLSQEDVGLDVTTSVRYRTVGPELTGSQLAARVNVGRSLGPLYLAVNGGVGQGFGVRNDVDYEAGSLLFVRAARVLRIGAETRVRGEVADRYDTLEDKGRPIDVLAGSVVGVELDRVLVQGLGGWSWPRGPFASGPAALAAASFMF